MKIYFSNRETGIAIIDKAVSELIPLIRGEFEKYMEPLKDRIEADPKGQFIFTFKRDMTTDVETIGFQFPLHDEVMVLVDQFLADEEVLNNLRNPPQEDQG